MSTERHTINERMLRASENDSSSSIGPRMSPTRGSDRSEVVVTDKSRPRHPVRQDTANLSSLRKRQNSVNKTKQEECVKA